MLPQIDPTPPERLEKLYAGRPINHPYTLTNFFPFTFHEGERHQKSTHTLPFFSRHLVDFVPLGGKLGERGGRVDK